MTQLYQQAPPIDGVPEWMKAPVVDDEPEWKKAPVIPISGTSTPVIRQPGFSPEAPTARPTAQEDVGILDAILSTPKDQPQPWYQFTIDRQRALAAIADPPPGGVIGPSAAFEETGFQRTDIPSAPERFRQAVRRTALIEPAETIAMGLGRLSDLVGAEDQAEGFYRVAEDYAREIRRDTEPGAADAVGGFVGIFLNPMYQAAFALGGKITGPVVKVLGGKLGPPTVQLLIKHAGLSEQTAQKVMQFAGWVGERAASGSAGLGTIGGIEGAASTGTVEGAVEGVIQGVLVGAPIGVIFGGIGLASRGLKRVIVERVPEAMARRRLGLSPLGKVTKEQLKKAYRKAAVKAHPDRGGTDEAFIRVARAYETMARRIKIIKVVSQEPSKISVLVGGQQRSVTPEQAKRISSIENTPSRNDLKGVVRDSDKLNAHQRVEIKESIQEQLDAQARTQREAAREPTQAEEAQTQEREVTDAQAIPSPQEEVRIDEGRQDIRGQRQDREGAQPTRQKPEAQVSKAKFQPEPTEKVPASGTPAFAAVGRGRPSDKPSVEKPFINLERTRSPDKGIEDFFGRTKRLFSINSKLKQLTTAISIGARERFIFLPKLPPTAEASVARELIRTMPEQRRVAGDKAVPDLEKVLNGDPKERSTLDVAGLDLLSRKVFTEDMIVESERAIKEAELATEATAEELSRIKSRRSPRGVEHDALLQERKRLDALIAKSPAVTDAYKRHQELWSKVSQDLLNRGVISEEAAKNQHYVRHYVLEYMDGKRQGSGGRQKALRDPFRPYSKLRKGTGKDTSTDYLNVQLNALRDIYMDNSVQDAAEKIGAEYDRGAELRKEAKKTNESLGPGEKKVTAEQLAKTRNLVPWQFKRGNVFYEALTITESQVARLVEESLGDPAMSDALKIPVSALRESLVIGGKRKTFFIPDWLAAQLDDLPVQHQRGVVVSFTAPPIQLWKRWILRVNPIRYNRRNFIGDSEAVNAAGRTHAFTRIPEAVRFLASEKVPTEHAEAYQRGLEHGVFGSSLWHEMGEAVYTKQFEQFRNVQSMSDWQRVGNALGWVAKKPGQAGQWLQDMTQAREDILRVAVYLDALDDVVKFQKTGKPIRHWHGRVSREQVQELAKKDKYAAAAKVSRETLGDYGAFTPWENDFLRQGLAPFYSWMKINTVRWPRLLAGATAEAGPKAGTKVAGIAAFRAARFVPRAIGLGSWLGRILWAYGAMFLYNNRDEESRKRESTLPDWIRTRPHVTLENGVVYDSTALSDFAEWFGMENILPDLRRWSRGQITTKELATAVTKAEAKEPVNRIINALNPFLKAPITALGFRTFPDPLDARQFAQAFSKKAHREVVLDVLGTDVRRFVDSRGERLTLREAFTYYFSGSAWRPMSPEKLEAEIVSRMLGASLSTKSAVTKRKPGEPKKGRERDFDILVGRAKALGITREQLRLAFNEQERVRIKRKEGETKKAHFARQNRAVSNAAYLRKRNALLNLISPRPQTEEAP